MYRAILFNLPRSKPDFCDRDSSRMRTRERVRDVSPLPMMKPSESYEVRLYVQQIPIAVLASFLCAAGKERGREGEKERNERLFLEFREKRAFRPEEKKIRGQLCRRRVSRRSPSTFRAESRRVTHRVSNARTGSRTGTPLTRARSLASTSTVQPASHTR